jgi:hypothetical protein
VNMVAHPVVLSPQERAFTVSSSSGCCTLSNALVAYQKAQDVASRRSDFQLEGTEILELIENTHRNIGIKVEGRRNGTQLVVLFT